MPQLGVAVHHRLGVLVVLGRPALHEVRRKGERRAGESDQRGGAQLGQDHVYGLRDIGEVLGRQLRKPVEVGPFPEWLGHDRSHPRHDVKIDADGSQRNHDVAKEDGRVHTVASHWLHRDLGDQVWPPAGVEHPYALAHLAVLRQRAARLAHEPHRRVGHALTSGGTDQGTIAGAVRQGRHPQILARGNCPHGAGHTAIATTPTRVSATPRDWTARSRSASSSLAQKSVATGYRDPRTLATLTMPRDAAKAKSPLAVTSPSPITASAGISRARAPPAEPSTSPAIRNMVTLVARMPHSVSSNAYRAPRSRQYIAVPKHTAAMMASITGRGVLRNRDV